MSYVLSPHEVSLIAVSGFGAMQKIDEFKELLAVVKDLAPIRMMEIGLGKAGASWAFSKFEGLKQMIALDLPNGPWGGSEIESSLKYITENAPVQYDYIAGNSQNSEALAAVKEKLRGESLDFLFIDGDHSYAGVKSDFLIYSPLVRKGGLIAFHDICEHSKESGCEVKKWWDELKETYPKDKYVEFIEPPINWGGIAIIEKI